MWAAKLPGEGAALYDACEAMCKLMSELGIAIDGGKDSLSMAARLNKEVIKAPGNCIFCALSRAGPSAIVMNTVGQEKCGLHSLNNAYLYINQ